MLKSVMHNASQRFWRHDKIVSYSVKSREEQMKYSGGYVTGAENTWSFAVCDDKNNQAL